MGNSGYKCHDNDAAKVIRYAERHSVRDALIQFNITLARYEELRAIHEIRSKISGIEKSLSVGAMAEPVECVDWHAERRAFLKEGYNALRHIIRDPSTPKKALIDALKMSGELELMLGALDGGPKPELIGEVVPKALGPGKSDEE